MNSRFGILASAALLAGLSAAVCGHSAPTRVSAVPATPARPAPPPPPADADLQDLTDFLDRAARLKDNDIDGRLALARWARDRKMWSQAAEMADQVLYRDPLNRAAYLILQQVDDARPLPAEEAQENEIKDEFARRFAHDFKVRNSRHFLMCYDTTDEFAAQRGAVMEKVYDAFQFYFTMSTLRPDFLDRRLVVVLLKSRDDYLSYAQKTEGNPLAWSSGFYSQRSNRSVFFDDSSSPTAASFAKQAATLRDQISALNEQIAAANRQNQKGLANSLAVERNRIGEALAGLTSRVGTNIQMMNNVKTMHEAAHQVSFNMGIQSRLVDYPMWFSEGLACSFEIEDASGHRGPAVLNYGRIAGVKEALKAGRLTPLDEFITADPPGRNDDKSLELIYAEGWALFHYLYRFHRDGMEKYLLLYKGHAPLRTIKSDERKVLFIKAFGEDLAELNRKFVAYCTSLPAKPN